MSRLLLIEDSQGFTLKSFLQNQGFVVETMASPWADKEFLGSFDAIVLELPEAKEAVFSRLAEFRGEGYTTPVLILTANIAAAVKGLNHGADDFLTLPFEPHDLLPKLRELAGPLQGPAGSVLRIYDLEIDEAANVVRRGGKPIRLTRREFALLRLLAAHRGRVVSRSKIREKLYALDDMNSSNVVDVFIRYLRTKIDVGFEQPLILTRRGQGYLLRGDASPTPALTRFPSPWPSLQPL